MSDNPSIQCSVCGQWKRYTRKSGPDAGANTFYPVCGENHDIEHKKPVCHECCQTGCPYRNEPTEKPKDVALIYSIKHLTEQPQDKNLWCAEMNGEVIDYHSKEELIRNAESRKQPWRVIALTKHGFYTLKKSLTPTLQPEDKKR
jgi:hypothetical protein